MDLTLAQIRAIAPHAPEAALAPLNAAMSEAAIDTPLRQAAFIAQCAFESDQFRQLVEAASGDAYEDNTRLGNVVPGDGARFKGRGVIQLTGRSNYARASVALGIDLVGIPALAAEWPTAARTAAWYWSSRALNALADDGDFVGITVKINGGLLGLAQRKSFYTRALAALNAVPVCGDGRAP